MFNRNENRRSKRKKKEERRKKSNPNISIGLDSRTNNFLCKHTRYDQDEIYEWFKVFQADCPDGKLYKSKIIDMYAMIIPRKNASILVDHIFRVFDKDSNGFIDFREFMIATDMTSSCGTSDEKLRWAFKMYDEDGSGNIEKGELQEMITALLEIQGMSDEVVALKVSQMFASLDVDGNGLISEEEFVLKCQEGKIAVGPTKEERNQKEKFEPRNQKEKKTDPKPRTLLDKNLEKHDLEYLCNFTRFSKREIEECGFIEDCPSGKLHKKKALEMYKMILPEKNAIVFVNHIFRIFDKDNNGYIDFKEFMIATDMTTGGSVEERLRWAFKMYDQDGSGIIELHEMEDIVITLFELNDGSLETAKECAMKMFKQLDKENAGEISEEQFIVGCINDPGIVFAISNLQTEES